MQLSIKVIKHGKKTRRVVVFSLTHWLAGLFLRLSASIDGNAQPTNLLRELSLSLGYYQTILQQQPSTKPIMPPTTSPRALPPESPRPLPRPPTPSRSPSLAERRSIKPRPVPTRLEPVMEGDTRFLRDVQKPQPADPLKRRGSSPQLVRQRSQQYFEQAFGSRRDGQVVDREERVRAMAMVIAEVKTNVFVCSILL